MLAPFKIRSPNFRVDRKPRQATSGSRLFLLWAGPAVRNRSSCWVQIHVLPSTEPGQRCNSSCPCRLCLPPSPFRLPVAGRGCVRSLCRLGHFSGTRGSGGSVASRRPRPGHRIPAVVPQREQAGLSLTPALLPFWVDEPRGPERRGSKAPALSAAALGHVTPVWHAPYSWVLWKVPPVQPVSSLKHTHTPTHTYNRSWEFAAAATCNEYLLALFLTVFCLASSGHFRFECGASNIHPCGDLWTIPTEADQTHSGLPGTSHAGTGLPWHGPHWVSSEPPAGGP